MPFLFQILHFAFQECAQVGHNVSFTYPQKWYWSQFSPILSPLQVITASLNWSFENSDLQEMLFYCNF